MIIQPSPAVHLTYCLNVHPGESWEENFAAIKTKALAVRDRVARGQRFGLGLRLSAAAAEQLIKPPAMDEFHAFLQRENLYVFTINGFPYGQFHNAVVKQDVYAPDWRTTQRVRYTAMLASILAQLLPPDVPGSISTVPLTYKSWAGGDDDIRHMVEFLASTAVGLRHLAEQGSFITLGLEPEPDCLIENTDETIAFFQRWGPYAAEYLHTQFDVPAALAEKIWREHVGVCFDTAHAAVEFEDPAESLKRLVDAGIRISKVQLSSAIRTAATPEALARLEQFVDKVYLHQAKARTRDGRIESFADLPQALAAAAAGGLEELRVHYHVPLFFEGDGVISSTSDMLTGEFAGMLGRGACSNVEIETYTFTVLPDYLRPADISAGIASEFDWTIKHVFGR